MFVNDLENNRTVDLDTGAELRRVFRGGGEDDRPDTFVLTIDGARITFQARRNNIKNPENGLDALRWRVGWLGVGDQIRNIPPYNFRSQDERRQVEATIADALRVYRTFLGQDTRPVLEVVFVPAQEWK
jgi:hypothetical protein